MSRTGSALASKNINTAQGEDSRVTPQQIAAATQALLNKQAYPPALDVERFMEDFKRRAQSAEPHWETLEEAMSWLRGYNWGDKV